MDSLLNEEVNIVEKKFKDRLQKLRVNSGIFYVFQFLLVFVALLYYLGLSKGIFGGELYVSPSLVLGFVLLMILINGIILSKDRKFFRKIQAEAYGREDSIINIIKLNRDLRAQRHDFLNHIQVLYSLMELEEYEETRTYLNHLYGDIIKVGNRIKTKSVSVNALLQAKANEAEKKGIHFDLILKSQLEDIPIGEWEFCRILGNLIDNGFEALSNVNISKKVLTIQIYEAITVIEIRVRNNGAFVPEKMVNKIFEAGISSKKDKADHGMGLYIVRKLLEDEGHSIVLEQEGDVCFHITLKK